MARFCFVVAAVTIALVGSGCGSSDPRAPADGGALDSAAGDSASRDTGAPTTDAIAIDAPAGDAAVGPGECATAGGVCGCAGGCNLGYHPAPAPLLDMCPQPCPTCGACSQWCCLPDADAGPATTCDAETCGPGQYCIRPCCGGAEPPCLPAPDGGPCPAGSTECIAPGGDTGCQTFCTPPPSYCSDTIPVGCMLDGSGEVLCLCA